MKIKLPLVRTKKIALGIFSLCLLSAIPYFSGSGLDSPEPMGAFLNGAFPDKSNASDPYISVFPNLSFDSPLTFTPVPNTNKLVVGQRDGKIYWFENRNDVAGKNLLKDYSNEVGVVWDGGFLGLSIHPDFGTNGKNYFYLFYTTKDGQGRDYPDSFLSGFGCSREDYWGGFLILKRIEVDPVSMNVIVNSNLEMIKMRMFSSTHRGGGMAFGDDGFLYIPTGDQSAYSKPQNSTTNLDGGVLRIDVDQDPNKSHAPIRKMPQGGRFPDEISGVGYGIPNDNPFLSPDGSRFEEYYTLGHRNPHRMTKDKLTGTFYIGEIGEGTHEEINIIKPGKNYGWPVYEGYYNRGTSCTNLLDGMPHEGPLVAFPRSDANALIGGYVYRGAAMPDYYGKYICADYGVGEEIWAVDIVTGAYETITQFSPTNIISFGEDHNGELYLLSQGNNVKLYKLRQQGELEGSVPQLLSKTGAFTNLQTLETNSGILPYELIESFWSDGAEKKRWMAVPNNGTHNTPTEQISFSENGDWQFPVGSVLIKHFELPIDENNPSLTKRLETRFSIKASTGSFYFLTYKWNEQQTDAVLLPNGLDENITITKTDGSTATQKWSYPSTQDCISCHNPATGGALGTNTRYLNSDYTYQKTGRTANQLVTLSHLGVLNETITDAATVDFQTYRALDDPLATLDEKARSYMDLNCAYCHRPGGTGDRAQFDLRLFNTLAQTGLFDAGTNTPIGIPGERIFVPGNADESILFHRTNSVDPSIMMPPISKNQVDAKAVQLIRDWIDQMDPETCGIRNVTEDFSNTSANEWTTSGTASTGTFVIADPTAQTSSGILTQPEDDHSATDNNAFFTATNTSVGVNDVDGGVAIATSPTYTVVDESELSIWYFFGQRDAGDDNSDYFLLEYSIDGGATYTTLASYGDETVVASWTNATAIIPSNSNLVVRVSAADGPNDGDIVEAGIDDFTITSICPDPIRVTAVELTPETLNLIEGTTQQLNALVSPADADDISVTWSSDNNDIATVDSNGVVNAIQEGTATVTVTTNDGQFMDTTVISVERAQIPVTGISLSLETLTLIQGQAATLIATVAPQDADEKEVVWTTNNPQVATVDNNGKVTATGLGEASVTVTTLDGGFTASTFITVNSAPNVEMLIAPNPADYVVYVYFGYSEPLNITTLHIYDQNNNLVKTFTDPASILDGENYRLPIADLPIGNYTIEGVSTIGIYQKTLSIFRESISVTGITLSLPNANVQVGNELTLIPTITPSNATDKTVLWNSDNSNIVTVDSSGNIKGVSEGIATITATTVDGNFTATSTVNVSTNPVNNVTILMAPTPADYVVYVFFDALEPLEITALRIYDDNKILVKTFDDPTLVLVEGDNYRLLINDLPVGVYTVEGVSTTGTYSKQLTIARDNVPVTGLTLGITTANMIVGEQLTIPATIVPSDATDKTVIWSSSDETIATVNEFGTVTALSQGEITITAITADGDYEATSTITVEPIIMLIAPNPATFVIYVYFYSPNPMEISTINIYDAMGRLVKTFNDPEATLVEGNNYRLLVEELPSGYYFVEGVTSLGNYQKQIVIE
ncbi:Ig-like domain-containing protein [Maribacter confluentis]|uniref:Ig-like domain-containing protein n=1 Tax=Maribacter confluentis TaxID=1656093 RepID=A0ABT8RM64_9FLAO|nr:Ig-like domain-containing protein [Maribacter confluentis]MDO1511875.1 Ig-like domain-containing protein [Maribacter confluentis]